MRLPPEVFLGQQLEATLDPRQIVLLERMPRLRQELLSKLRACSTHLVPSRLVAECPRRQERRCSHRQERRWDPSLRSRVGIAATGYGVLPGLRSAFNSRSTLSL